MSRKSLLEPHYDFEGKRVEPNPLEWGELEMDDLDRAIFEKWWEAWVKKEGIDKYLSQVGIDAIFRARSIAWAGFKLGWYAGCEECQ